VEDVDVDEGRAGILLLARTEGIFTETAGGTTVACLTKLVQSGRLDPALETTVYRVAQEAISNVAKHARASRLWVALEGDGDAVELRVRDDGAGFDPDRQGALIAAGHLGLLGMRERVETAGGTWALSTGPGAGVAIRATFPLARREVPA
jgi:signal transduction histidine kinase